MRQLAAMSLEPQPPLSLLAQQRRLAEESRNSLRLVRTRICDRIKVYRLQGEKESVCISLSEVANKDNMKHCSNCGKKIEKPILFKGYVFCSEQCRESFTTARQ